MISKAWELEISIVKVGNGATLIDAGFIPAGSYEAGRLFAEACMGGLGSITFSHDPELLVPSYSKSFKPGCCLSRIPVCRMGS